MEGMRFLRLGGRVCAGGDKTYDKEGGKNDEPGKV
jgi:hypothetical protein